MEQYASNRAEGEPKDEIIARAWQALVRSRVTQLECVLMKTAKKSKHPAERMQTAISNFETEELGEGRHDAKSNLGPPILAFCQAYGLLKGDAHDVAA